MYVECGRARVSRDPALLGHRQAQGSRIPRFQAQQGLQLTEISRSSGHYQQHYSLTGHCSYGRIV
jgi:hypothetical protein